MKLALRKQFASIVRRNKYWQSDQPIVVAVSTGVDSMVLLDLLLHLRTRIPKIIVAHVNHKLRIASDEEQLYIEDYCKAHGIELAETIWPRADHPKNGVEAAARDFRYAFFKEVMNANHAQVLVTAHHQNDQAETVLMKLIRGDSIGQVRGIQPERRFANGGLVRPLLAFSKKTLIEYANEASIKWFEDQTNQDDDVMRNRVRHNLLPMMERENPRIVSALSQFASQISEVLSTNQFMLEQLINQIKVADYYHLAPFLKFPLDVQKQLLFRIDRDLGAGRPLNAKQVQNILRILNNHQKPQGIFKINASIILRKTYVGFKLDVSKIIKKNAIKINKIMVRLNHWYRINDRMTVGVFTPQSPVKLTNAHILNFQLNVSCLPLTIRPWQPQDKVTLKSGGHQKVKRVLINQKVPNAQREQAMVLVDNNDRVISLLGYKDSIFVENDGAVDSYQLLIRT